jgi:hypothetical protein
VHVASRNARDTSATRPMSCAAHQVSTCSHIA